MITESRLGKASPEAVARLFCWLMFRPLHLDRYERDTLALVRKAMGPGLPERDF